MGNCCACMESEVLSNQNCRRIICKLLRSNVRISDTSLLGLSLCLIYSEQISELVNCGEGKVASTEDSQGAGHEPNSVELSRYLAALANSLHQQQYKEMQGTPTPATAHKHGAEPAESVSWQSQRNWTQRFAGSSPQAQAISCRHTISPPLDPAAKKQRIEPGGGTSALQSQGGLTWTQNLHPGPLSAPYSQNSVQTAHTSLHNRRAPQPQ